MHVAMRRTIDRSIHLPSIKFSIDDESSVWRTSVTILNCYCRESRLRVHHISSTMYQAIGLIV